MNHDTLKFAQALREAGHEARVAEGTAAAVAAFVGEGAEGLATREEMRSEFKLVREETRAEFKLVREEMHSEFKLVREEMRGMEDRITLRLIKWMGGIAFITVAATLGAIGGAVYFLAGLIARLHG